MKFDKNMSRFKLKIFDILVRHQPIYKNVNLRCSEQAPIDYIVALDEQPLCVCVCVRALITLYTIYIYYIYIDVSSQRTQNCHPRTGE